MNAMRDTEGAQKPGGPEPAARTTASDGDSEKPVDKAQDELMAQESTDGRPPPRPLRIAEWRWAAVVGLILLVGVVLWTVSRRLDAKTILVGVALIAALVVAAAPVWGAGLMRGREERDARQQARKSTGTERPGRSA
jgi:hypothetical protein